MELHITAAVKSEHKKRNKEDNRQGKKDKKRKKALTSYVVAERWFETDGN